jgi:DNA-binding MarR family transcriptional regulator
MTSKKNEQILYSAIEGLQRLTELFERRRQRLAQSVGLTDGQWRVLEGIATLHFMPSLFARRQECSPAAVSRTLRQLQDKGLVSASISSSDARQREYSLTPSGSELLSKLRAHRARAIERVWSDLAPEQLAQFAAFSIELADRLEAYAADSEAG